MNHLYIATSIAPYASWKWVEELEDMLLKHLCFYSAMQCNTILPFKSAVVNFGSSLKWKNNQPQNPHHDECSEVVTAPKARS